jgi:hypothetical protein
VAQGKLGKSPFQWLETFTTVALPQGAFSEHPPKKVRRQKLDMICQATYDSLESIPETLRDEFHSVNGKWQLKDTAIPGVGPLFNSALAANEAKAVGQVKTRNEKIKTLEEELNTAKDRLSVLDTPGTKVLSKADGDTFDAYTKLGTPTEIESKLKNHTELETKVATFETGAALSKVTEANGLGDVKLNPEVLTDWLASADAKGLKAFVKTVESTDAKGVKTSVEVPYIRVEKTVDGKIEVTEKELLPFAKETLPEWKYSALTSGNGNGNGNEPGKGKPAPLVKGAGVKIPDLGSARKTVDEGADKKRPVDVYNEQRASKPSPFSKQQILAPGQQPQK